MTEVVLLQGAQADLLEHYTRRGDAVYEQIDEELEVIRRNPEIAPIFLESLRRRVVPKSPYGIFYRVVGRRVMVSAVLDLRQSPEVILRRLKP